MGNVFNVKLIAQCVRIANTALIKMENVLNILVCKHSFMMESVLIVMKDVKFVIWEAARNAFKTLNWIN